MEPRGIGERSDSGKGRTLGKGPHLGERADLDRPSAERRNFQGSSEVGDDWDADARRALDAGPPPHPGDPPSLRARLSRHRASVMTALGWPMGFFTQYPYVRQVQPVTEPYPEVEARCEASPFRDFLRRMQGYRPTFASFGRTPGDPVLGRGMFPALDGMAAYVAVRRFAPARILEIGSGDSTYFLARGVGDNGHGKVTCIDPRPRRNVMELGVALEPRVLHASDADRAGDLRANDILFIDSSHVLLPGMDVDIELNRMFPRLRRGVIVHLHDIFLPDDYPLNWKQRNYSEQNGLVGWLLGGAFEILWPANYVYTRHTSLVEAAVGSVCDVGRGGGSLWLRKT